jgi:phosphoglycerate dehydrogenase-like enzyme
MMNRPRILYVPNEKHTERVFRKEVFERFLRLFDVDYDERGLSLSTILRLASEADGIVTGWGCPPLEKDFFEKAGKLRIIAHSAGSIKPILSREVVQAYVLPRNICVFSARHAIALNVAEATVGYMIMASRRLLDHILAFREKGLWRDISIPSNGQYLRGSIVGIVGASTVGRELIRLLKPFDVTILVYDPYLTDWEAGFLGVYKASLEELFSRSDIVSLHAPLTPETSRMINRDLLKRMKDRAILINTARGGLIDQEALIQECSSGRLLAVLDVTDPEPPPQDSPLRGIKNILVTPHVAGAGYYGYFKIGEGTLKALEEFFSGRPVDGRIDLSQYDILA